jgi:hypothetical protein
MEISRDNNNPTRRCCDGTPTSFYINLYIVSIFFFFNMSTQIKGKGRFELVTSASLSVIIAH